MTTVYFEPCAGLGNRLYGLLSILYYRSICDFDLHIVWKTEPACAAGFDLLFDRDAIENATISEVVQMGYKGGNALRTIKGNFTLKKYRQGCDFYEPADIIAYYNEKGEQGIIDLLSSEKKLYIKCTACICEREHLYSGKMEIVPSELILERVRNVIEAYDDKRLIGIHIRRTDNVDAIKSSPTKLFEDKMSELSSEDVVFYLATDDERERIYLEKRFDLVSVDNLSGKKTRKTANGIIDAFVDMVCLSMCECIYGCKKSTFSQMASILGKIELHILSVD